MSIDPQRIREASAELHETGLEPVRPKTVSFAKPGTELVPAVVDAEIIEARQIHRAVAVVRDVATHDRTRTAARHIAYVAAGGQIVWRRRQERHGTAFYDDAIRAALVLGDLTALQELTAAKREAERDRDQRKADRTERRLQILAKAPAIAKTTAVLLALTGIAAAWSQHDAAKFIAPFEAVADLVNFLFTLVVVLWEPAAVTCAAAILYRLWKTGHTSQNLPAWALPPGQQPLVDDAITPSIVVVALRDLGITALKKAINDMGDMGAAMLGPITEAGPGVEVEITLPSGTSTIEVQARRRKLAENLGRHERELHITVAKKARTITLWIADSGALDEPVGPSPLTWDDTLKADYYTGRAPWGWNLRNVAILVSLFQQHVLITGKSNQGKTASMRALALWLALDPTVEFRMADLKGVGDWAMFRGIATILIEGPTDEDVMAATLMVEGLVEEMNRRIDALKKSGSEEGITRDMARKPGSGFHPLIGIVDEAQVAYMCGAKGPDGRPYGGQSNASRYYTAVRQIHNQGRAVNVTLWQGTQDPNDKNLPAIARDGAHIRAALYLPTESKAKMALGEAPVEQGAAPHKLRDGLDRGTVIVHGPGIPVPVGEPAITIRTHFIDGKDANVIADRAKAIRRPVATRDRADEREPTRDLLADLVEVLNGQDERVRLSDLPALLRDLAPKWDPYQPANMNGVLLAEILEAEPYRIKIFSTGNVPRLDPDELRGRLWERVGDRDEGELGGLTPSQSPFLRVPERLTRPRTGT